MVITSSNPLTNKLAPVLLGIHVVAFPLYPHMPAPVLLLTMVFTVWSWLIISGRVAQPGRLVMLLLTAAVVAVLLQSFGTVFGQLPG